MFRENTQLRSDLRTRQGLTSSVALGKWDHLFSPCLSKSFTDTVWLAEGARHIQPKHNFPRSWSFKELAHQQVNTHLHPIYYFFFNLWGESSSHSEGTLGKFLLGSPAAPNISLHHYANAALVFPHSGGGTPSQLPNASNGCLQPVLCHHWRLDHCDQHLSLPQFWPGFCELPSLDVLVAAPRLRVSPLQFSKAIKH